MLNKNFLQYLEQYVFLLSSMHLSGGFSAFLLNCSKNCFGFCGLRFVTSLGIAGRVSNMSRSLTVCNQLYHDVSLNKFPQQLMVVISSYWQCLFVNMVLLDNLTQLCTCKPL